MAWFKRYFLLLLFISFWYTSALGQNWYAQSQSAFRDGEFESANQLIQKAIEQFKSENEPDSLVFAYVHKSAIQWDLFGINEALEMADSAIFLSENLNTSTDSKIAALNKKGQLLVHDFYWNEAENTFQKAESLIREQDKKSPLISTLYNNISWLYLNLQNLEKAYSYGLKSLEIQKELYGENDRKLMGVYQSLGLIANDRADYENAEKFSFKLYEIAKANLDPDHPTMALVYNQLAIIQESRFRYAEAIQYLQEMANVSQKNYEKTGNPQFLAIAYNNLGNIYHKLNEFPLAEPYFSKSVILHSENYGEDEIGIIQPIIHLASSKMHLGKLDEADSLFQFAYLKQQILEKENLPGLAALESQIGDLFAYKSMPEEAILWYTRALEHYQASNIENFFLVGETHTSIGKEFLNSENYKQSIEHYEKALEIYKKLYPDSRIVVSSKYNDLSLAFLKEGNQEAAWKYSDSTFIRILGQGFIRSEKWTDLLPPNYRIAFFIENRINLIWAKNLENESQENLLEIIELADGYSRNFQKSIFSLRTQYSLIELAKEHRKILQHAIDACWILATKFEKKEYFEIAFRFSELEKGVLLRLASNNMMISESIDADDSIAILDQYWRDQINGLNSNFMNNPNDSILNQLTYSMESYSIFQDSIINLDIPIWNERYSLEPYSIEEIQRKLLGNNNVLIEFSVSENRIYAFVLSDASLKTHMIDRNSISRQIEELNQLKNLEFEEFKSVSHVIFNELISPFYSDLKDKNIIIIPDRELYSVNFESLIKNQDGENFSELSYLIKDHEISYLLSTSTSNQFIEKKKKDSKNGLFIAPGFTDQMKQSYISDHPNQAPIQSQLIRQPFSLLTAELASNMVKGSFYQQTEAQESLFYENASDFEILHLATHGEVDNAYPMNSHLYMAYPNESDSANQDGIIHAFEIYGLQLQAELAVLSACNTGSGKFQDGEGLISLAHSFLHAGCSAVLMSMWEIDEKTSSEILMDFYKNLTNGESKSASLRSAKLSFLEQSPPELAHPYYWAGLGLIGDKSPLESNKGFKNLLWIFLGALIVSALTYYFLRKKI